MWTPVFEGPIIMLPDEPELCQMQDPLAIIGIISILLPFIILGICIATGVIDVNAGKA